MTTQTKPKCKLTGTDGNIFALVGKASRTLKNVGQREKATDQGLTTKLSQSLGNM